MSFNKYRILLVKLRLKLFYKLFYKLLVLNFFINNTEILTYTRYLFYYYFSFFYKIFLLLRLNCIQSGRFYALNSFFYFDRFVLRSETNSGNLLGYSRYSW